MVGGALLKQSTMSTFDEVASGKVPGMDEIRLKMLKALDVVGLSWLTKYLFNVMEDWDNT